MLREIGAAVTGMNSIQFTEAIYNCQTSLFLKNKIKSSEITTQVDIAELIKELKECEVETTTCKTGINY